MTSTVFVKFSYEDRLSQEIAIDLGVDIDLTKNSNRKKLINRLLKSDLNITEVSLSQTK
jgi:hypothetical protein